MILAKILKICQMGLIILARKAQKSKKLLSLKKRASLVPLILCIDLSYSYFYSI